LSEIDSKICYIDTPGVNSTQNKEHRELTDEMICDDNCDGMIFLLNGENIGTDDDSRHLRYVLEHYHGTILFLVNKLDRFKKEVDSVSATLKRVKEDLEKIGFPNPKVYPVSAYGAYLTKMYMHGEKLSEDELDELNFRKRKLSREEFRYDTYYESQVPEVNENNETEVLLRNSGILSLEKIIYKWGKAE
jgi:GTPase Era involved in 16S rRNA processing